MQKLFTLLLLSAVFTNLYAQSWTFKGEKQGVKGYTRIVGKNIEMKFTAQVKVRQLAFVGLLKDVTAQTKWMTGVSQATLLKETNQPLEIYYHCIAPFPWPMDNRDLVMHGSITQDPTTKALNIKVRPKPTYIAAKADHVRLKTYEIDVNLKPVTGGTTAFECYMRVNQADGIPTWVLDWFVSEKFFKSIQNLCEMVKTAPYKDYSNPTIKE